MINANYKKLWGAFFLSSIGDWLYKLAIPLLLYEKTGSPLVMAITYGITFLPFVLVTPFGGVLADRLSRKKILVMGDLSSFLLTALLGVLVYFNIQHLWVLYILVFLIASVNSLYHPVFQSIIPQLVDEAQLAKANAHIASAENTILLIGPACSGLIIALLGPTLAIFVNAGSFLLSAVFIKTIKVKPQLMTSVKLTIVSVIKDLKEGFIFSYQHPIVKFGCLLFVFINFGVQLVLANFMFYLTSDLKLTPDLIGFTYAIIGLGAICGSMTAPMLMKRISSGRLILLGCLGAGLATSLLAWLHHWVAIGIAGGLMFACTSIVIVTYFTLRQKVVPNHYLGRVIATTRLISYCAIPLASLLGGWLLQQHVSYQLLVLLGSLIIVVDAVLGWLTPLNTKKSSTLQTSSL